MTLPPLLFQHVEELKGQGFIVDVTESAGEICLVFKDYPLPLGMWSKDKVDLLVIATPAYPNAKMDMFWVNPGLQLRDGRAPEAGSSMEGHCGKQWQRFSWHPQAWNPATDNLITYLELVNHRLHMSQ